jgi:hypothetical protein
MVPEMSCRDPEEQANRVTSCMHITRITLRDIRRELLCKMCEHIPGSHLPETEGETRGPHGSRTRHIRRNCFRRTGPPPPHLGYYRVIFIAKREKSAKTENIFGSATLDLTMRSALTGLVIVGLHRFWSRARNNWCSVQFKYTKMKCLKLLFRESQG